MNEELPFYEILDHVSELVEEAMTDPKVASKLQEILDWLDAFHREGIGSLVEMIRDWRGELFLERAAANPAVNALLGFYGLGVDLDQVQTHRTVQMALDDVRPYVHSHGGDIEVLEISDGVVRLQMHGTCDGCTASDVTIKERIEVVLHEKWPQFRRVEVEKATADPHPPPSGTITTGLRISHAKQ